MILWTDLFERTALGQIMTAVALGLIGHCTYAMLIPDLTLNLVVPSHI